jgi:hypothetical protein
MRQRINRDGAVSAMTVTLPVETHAEPRLSHESHDVAFRSLRKFAGSGCNDF